MMGSGKKANGQMKRVMAAIKSAGKKGVSEYGGKEKYASMKAKAKHEKGESMKMERMEKRGY